MYKSKSIKVILILLSMVLILAGCSSGKPNDLEKGKNEPIVWRLAHVMPADHPYNLGALKFAELLAEKTNGKYKVICYPNAELGTEGETMEMCASGQIELAQGWNGLLENYEPKVGVLCLPMLFSDFDHLWRVVDGEIGQELFKPLESKGIKVLGSLYNGVCNIVSTKKIVNPEDMQGVKTRIQSSKTVAEIASGLGAIVTPADFSEVYSALQLGAIEAEFQTSTNARKSKHEEVAKYTCENDLFYTLQMFTINNDLFESLSEEDQKAVLEASAESIAYQREIADKEAEEAHEYLKTKMEYTQPDIELWKEALAPVYDKFPEWADMVDKINAIK
jgi:tripartite ATP-independent transporter DctP family solute receptor